MTIGYTGSPSPETLSSLLPVTLTESEWYLGGSGEEATKIPGAKARSEHTGDPS